MKPIRRLFYALVVALLSALAAAQEESEIFIENLTPESEFSFQEGVWMGVNGVAVRYGTNMTLTADKIIYNEKTGDAQAEGNVHLQSGARLWRSEALTYNLKTRAISAESFRVGMPPFFAGGKQLRSEGTNGVYTAAGSFLTTDDIEDPSFRIQAKSMRIVPGQRIEAKQATVRVGKTPVMFFPMYSRTLERHPNNFVLTPGYRSLYGPYLLTTYNIHLNEKFRAGLNMDYRQKRGFGGGPEAEWNFDEWGFGEASFYYLRDEKPGLDPAGNEIRTHRHDINFSHQVNILSNLTAKVVVNQQSDAQMYRDFFESDYQKNPQPKSFLEVNQFWSNFSLNALVQPQLNDFFQTVERLPDVRLSGFRQQLGVSPFYYESETSAGYFRFDSPGPLGTNYSALRADTFHQILLPQTYFGWLNFTPRVGGRLTHYGETEGNGTTSDDQNRSVFNTGAELSAKASRIWGGARSKFWDINEIRHIIQPSLNYVYVPTPSKAPRELPQFDSEIPSLRLLPIDYPDYNSIDSVDSENTLRMGLRNKVQTKRKEGIDNLVNWALYTDWRLDPRANQNTFADFYSDFDLKPRSWFIISSEMRYDLDAGNIRAANHEFTIAPNDVWSLTLGHRYFREDPAFGVNSENNLFRSSVYYRMNENWGFRMTHHYEARDGTLEEQYYTVYRDLRSWTAALTFRVRENRAMADDFTVAVTFSLKAFPRFKLGQDRSQHSLLLGG